MAMTCRIYPDRQLAVIVAEGRVTGGNIRQAMAEVFHSPQWHPGFDAIWDARSVSELLISLDEFHSIWAASE